MLFQKKFQSPRLDSFKVICGILSIIVIYSYNLQERIDIFTYNTLKSGD
jgi:hypothetical protein